MNASRTGCVWCPDWPVIAARRRSDDADLRNRPLIVRERVGSRDIVRAASADARATGVTRGMRRRRRALSEAVCVDADEANGAYVRSGGRAVRSSRAARARTTRTASSPTRALAPSVATRSRGDPGRSATAGLMAPTCARIADGVFVARSRPVDRQSFPGGSAEYACRGCPRSTTTSLGLLVRLDCPRSYSRPTGARCGARPRQPVLRSTPFPGHRSRRARVRRRHLISSSAPSSIRRGTGRYRRCGERACRPARSRERGLARTRACRCRDRTRRAARAVGVTPVRTATLTPGVLAERVRWQLDADHHRRNDRRYHRSRADP